MTPEQAEIVALQALGWVVGEEDLRDVFLGATGASVEDLRSRAADVDFQGSVLGFLLMDDAWVMRFCDAHNLDYQTPFEAQQSLPGQGTPHGRDPAEFAYAHVPMSPDGRNGGVAPKPPEYFLTKEGKEFLP